MRLTWLLFALVAFGFLMAGCAQSPPANPAAGNNVSATAPNTAAPVVAPPPAPDFRADLVRLLGQMNSTAWKADYAVDMGAVTATPVTGMAVYRDGAGSFRTDISTPEMDVRMYHLNTDAASAGVACAKTSTMNWTCMKSSNLTADLFGSLSENLSQYTVVSLPSKTVAGVLASCYNVTNQTGTSLWGSACFSPSGALLFMQAAGKQSDGSTALATFSATSFSTSVPDSDFVLPAVPREESPN